MQRQHLTRRALSLLLALMQILTRSPVGRENPRRGRHCCRSLRGFLCPCPAFPSRRDGAYQDLTYPGR